MGVNATKGSFGLGIQTAKGVVASPITYIQASSVSVGIEQAATSLPPEVGGGMWAASSYKTGVQVTGDAAFNMRANTLGYLLKAFAGTASSAVSGEGFKHSFYEHSDVSFIPWLTLTRNTSDVWTEQYVDCRIDSLRLSIPAAGIVTGSVGFAGITPTQISNPTETWDDSPLFETCTGSVKFGGDATNKVTNITMDFSNSLSRDQQIVGSYYLDDISMVRRSCRVTCDTFLSSAAWYQQVYNNGGSAWDPAVFSASLEVEIETARHVVGSTHGKVRVVFPNIDYLVFPISMSGNDLIRVSMTAELTFGGTGVPFYFELTNNKASY